MAVIYLRSVDGDDLDSGATWALAKATAAAALTAAGAGGRVYASDNHAEAGAGVITLTSPGTASSRTRLLSVDDTADPEPPTAILAGAIIQGGGNFGVDFLGFLDSKSIHFKTSASSAASARFNIPSTATPCDFVFDTCTFTFAQANAGAFVGLGISSGNIDDQQIEWKNCNVEFGGIGQGFQCITRFRWFGGSVIIGVVPTHLFEAAGGGIPCDVIVSGVDLSGCSGNLVDATRTAADHYLFYACKLHASATIATGAIPGPGGMRVRAINCDSGDTNFNYYEKVGQGEILDETTIVRTGGGSDGTTGLSLKMVSTAMAAFYSPLVGPWHEFRNEALGSVTVTFEIVTDNVTLTDAEAWVEVEYLGTSGFPLALLASDRAADILATPANQTTSSETWTTTGLTTPVKQKLSVTFTTAEKGVVRARVMFAKASTTLYACPKILSTSYKQYMTPEGTMQNAPALPAVGEVETGVTYGADGTEFTGTLAAGGGGLLTNPGMGGGLRG